MRFLSLGSNQPFWPEEFKDPPRLLHLLKTKPEKYWTDRGEKMALGLFHAMAERVPAYQDFLKKNNIDHQKVKTIADFKQVPTISKQNYLMQYPREATCWDGKFAEKSWVISSTSGSTGEPFYFPRQNLQDNFYAVDSELYLLNNFEIDKKNTLFIVAFPLGVWIGGLFTYQALKKVADRGYKLSVITPGINKTEVIKAVKNLGSSFDQVIIGSYAPFLKDIIDDGIREGIKWQDYNLGFVFAAEVVSENFRNYLIKKTGLDNPYMSSLNIYGTVDLGTMAHETPLAIMMRRMGLRNPRLYKEMFSQVSKLPTLAQYLPEMFYFEEEKGNLYCSSYAGIPAVRYDLKDHGGILSFNDISAKFAANGRDLHKAARRAKLDETIWQLPFVYVYERGDFSVSFYAFQIYPEIIRRALQDEPFDNELTGKFTMEVKYDSGGQQHLDIHVELKSGVKATRALSERVRSRVVAVLLEESSEYRETHKLYGQRVFPRIKFWPYEDATYFRPGSKQRWVQK